MTAEDSDDYMDGSASKPDESEDQAKARKRKERLEQNRISARESRKRKKTMIEELQRTVITLSRENKDLNERNEQLRRQLMEIGAKVRKTCGGGRAALHTSRSKGGVGDVLSIPGWEKGGMSFHIPSKLTGVSM